MLETSGRLLRMLSLLQARPDWTSEELAQRLGVTTRTIRADVGRLRDLGYPIDARPGVAGGYRLGVGAALPPLLLDDEEAVAVAIGLRTAASGSVSGLEETALRALAKLQQVLPTRLRQRVSALSSHTLRLPSTGPRVDAETLATLASAAREHERAHFDYRAHSGADSRRVVEPYRLLNDRGRWYLLGYDVEREGWRTFRVDRVGEVAKTGRRFAARPLPPDDEIATQVARNISESAWRYRARVVVHASAEHVHARLPIRLDVEALGNDRCAFTPGSDHPQMLALYLGLLDADFEVVDAPELIDALRSIDARYRKAIKESAARSRPAD